MLDVLKFYGLSEKESEVYVACLRNGNSTANEISYITKVRRTTVYEVINQLKSKGIITSFKKDKKTYFNSVDPEYLIERLDEKKRAINSILPDLKKLNKLGFEKNEVKLYEGKAGIKSAVEECLKFQEVLLYGAGKAGDEIFGTYNENFAQKRVENKVHLKCILDSTPNEYMLKGKIAKFTSLKTFKFKENKNTAHFIYGDSVLIMTLGNELSAIKIKSKLYSDSQREIFKILWDLGNNI